MSALPLQLKHKHTKPVSTTTLEIRSALAKRTRSAFGQPTILNITVFWGFDAASFGRQVQGSCCCYLHGWTRHVAKNGWWHRMGLAPSHTFPFTVNFLTWRQRHKIPPKRR